MKKLIILSLALGLSFTACKEKEVYEEPEGTWYGDSAHIPVKRVHTGLLTLEEMRDKNPDLVYQLCGAGLDKFCAAMRRTMLIEIPEDSMPWPYCFKHETGINYIGIARKMHGTRGVR